MEIIKKPLKIAAYSYITFLILGFIATGLVFESNLGFIPITDFSLTSITLIFYIISFILSLFAVYGFIVLGKKFKNKFLIIITYIGIILLLIHLLYILFGGFFINIPEISTTGIFDKTGIDNFTIFFLLAYFTYSIIFGLHAIFFGMALLKLGKKIRYSKTAGILNISAGATMILSIGYFIMIVAIIMEILLLFEASKKFESKIK